MTRHITLSPQESDELKRIQKKQFCLDEVNTWPEYLEALTKWTNQLRAKYSLKDGEPFTFPC